MLIIQSSLSTYVVEKENLIKPTNQLGQKITATIQSNYHIHSVRRQGNYTIDQLHSESQSQKSCFEGSDNHIWTMLYYVEMNFNYFPILQVDQEINFRFVRVSGNTVLVQNSRKHNSSLLTAILIRWKIISFLKIRL